MKENKYDDPEFFEQYRKMPRSVQGLSAAGEWHELERLLPDFSGKRVLDLGCGMGWHCRYAAEKGADSVTGVDISEKMLEQARKDTPQVNIKYIRSAMEDFTFPPGSFDVVVSSLAFHYVRDFAEVARRVAACLVPDGEFVFSVEHPVFTAEGRQEWNRNQDGAILDWPVDNYFMEGERRAVFLGCEVFKYHKTLTTYVQALLAAGFVLTALVEPTPQEAWLKEIGEMRDELRRPMMLIMAGRKP